jgi:hypothetical protein
MWTALKRWLCRAMMVVMNNSEATRRQIIREHRSEVAKRAAATLRRKFGRTYFKKQGSKGGLKARRNRHARLSTS